MKHQFGKRLLSTALAGLLLLSGISVPAYAEEGGTITGEPETIRVTTSSDGARETNFNNGWKFYLGTSSAAQNQNFDDSSWKSVTLPHDFSISQSFTTSGEAESGFLPGGTGWYRKSFTLPASYEGKRLVLRFDGVYSDAYVYVNDTLVGENHYGYTSFAFDITDNVTCDGTTENVVAVKAVNTIPSSRWYSGSGIYRDVTLIAADPVHVALDGTYVTTPDISNDIGTVQVETEVQNDGESDVSVTVKNTVYTSSGDVASNPAEAEVTVPAGETVTVTSSPVVSSPKLWSTDSPNLYFVHTEVYADGVLTDSYDTTFGFRWFRFDSDNGFYLNDKAVKLNGVCLHHDQGALGSAAYYDAMYRQLSIMKDMGVNAVRTSHNPADKDFIRICNQLGLLVMEEAFDGWELAKNGNSYDFSRYFNTALTASNGILGGDSSMTWAEFAIKAMVKRDRNDPSVILWSIGNEVQEGTSTNSEFANIATKLIDWIKEVDSTRQTTLGSNQRMTFGTYGSLHSAVINGGGIAGFNYASASELASMHSTYGPIIASETSSAVNSRGIYSSQASASNADGKYHLTSYDTSTVSWGTTAHDSLWNTLTLDYVAGEFVWTGFDYIGEPTPWNGTGTGSVSGAGAIPNSSYFGIVDTAGFEKDTYYLYRSQWNQESTTLHLVTAWDADNMLTTSGKTPVVIYTNAAKVELYRNGTLIGTATRQVNTTSAGHTYYTYTTASADNSVCTAVSGSGSTSLYATFNVAYEAGTISAKAYDENGSEITATRGAKSVSTPEAAAQLRVTQNKETIAADGSSLVYIAVDVTDANGVLDTTAVNTIHFTLTGDGEIVGVDNGDQATTAKYQQSSVLTSSTSAQIAAYAGKALVIVRSTRDAGSFTVSASADGLTGGSADVTTYAVGTETPAEGLASYTMVRDYTVKAGTAPELLITATGTMSDGTEVTGTIAWDEISADTYSTAGDYTIRGTLTFAEQEEIGVVARLHVIADVIAVRNISAATMVGVVPTLPDVVSGILADGALSGEFSVIWNAMTEDQFANVGDIVTVNGTAKIMGETELPVTASVRVAEAVNTESTNVALSAAEVTQDVPEDKQSDTLDSVNNGITKPGDDTNERWSNWNNRTSSATAALTFRWDTAQLLNSVNVYYYYDSCAAKPESVSFEYSLNGTDYEQVVDTEELLVEEYSLGAEYTYTFAQPINPVALRITFTQQDGTTGTHCVAVTEIEAMTYAGQLEQNSSAALSSISVDGAGIDGFAADTLTYEASGTAVTAGSEVNAGITVLPALDGVVRILTVSEDGSDARTYAVTLSNTPVCAHEHTEVQNAKEATCTEEGYTGDIYCLDCGALVTAGEIIPAKGHTTVIQNKKDPTCTETGYTGDAVCTVCGETVSTGTTIPATGHSWDSGVVTKEATTTEEGVRTYTCIVCGETKTEAIPVLPAVKSAPSVTLTAAPASTAGKITLTATITGLNDDENYYSVTGHGFVYQTASRLGTRTLTVNTAGRTKVNCSGYRNEDEGIYVYNMTPASVYTKYVVRAWLSYTNDKGVTVYAYSSPVTVTYNQLGK